MPAPECADDDDCADGSFCLAQACEPIVVAPCVQDRHCMDGHICEAGDCVLGCATAGTALMCTGDDVCDEDTRRCAKPDPMCVEDGDCDPPATICTASQCVPGCDAVGGAACAMDEVCDPAVGRCQPKPQCVDDEACGAPAAVCVGGSCVAGCGVEGCDPGSTCDFATGRCVVLPAGCQDDAACGAPIAVCELSQCVPGCGRRGGVQCNLPLSCDPGSGRCAPGGPYCTSDWDCALPAEVCEVTTGDCKPGCSDSGCPSPLTCMPTGHCSRNVCRDDSFEDNDVVADATETAAGSLAHLVACPGDDDVYRLAAGSFDELVANVYFQHAEGNIDARLLDGAGAVLHSRTSTTDNETFVLTGDATGEMLLVVRLEQDAGPRPGTAYSLDVQHRCADDGHEPNDTRAQSATVALGRPIALKLCPSNDDYFTFDATAGELIDVRLAFTHAEGDVDVELMDDTGYSRRRATSATDDESLSHVASSSGRYHLRVHLFSDRGASLGNRYDLTISVAPPPTTVPVTFEVFGVDFTVPGQDVWVVGDIGELGAWSPLAGLKLDGARFPIWSETIDLPPRTAAEIKLVIIDANNNNAVIWEGGSNYGFTVPSTPTTITRSWRQP